MLIAVQTTDTSGRKVISAIDYFSIGQCAVKDTVTSYKNIY